MRRALFVILSGAVGFAAMAACQSLAGIGDLAIGPCKGGACPDDADTSGEGGSVREGGVLPAVDSGAPCLGKTPGVRVGSAENSFCIDPKEVSIADYQAFLDAKIDPATQTDVCVWNGTFTPSRPPVPDGGTAPPGTDPATYVDWCDARAYCAWAGKYLCGQAQNGKKTGPVTVEGLADYRTHQWMLACSAEARLTYPYGSLFDPSKCNLADYDAGHPVPVGSLPGCEGGFTGVFDLVGNVWEWYDGPCKSGSLEVDGGDGGAQSDGCSSLKGGSYGDRGPTIDCRLDLTVRRDVANAAIGFRCCSD
jgi:formylglycine-generating enzyme required for sulfatase activity